MCGIVGYVGRREAVSVLLPALRRLEYRGYDSAGVATLDGAGIEIRKAVGKIAHLEEALAGTPPKGRLGIAHTRWATHGRPSDANAHPHLDCSGRIAVVHNGIIENYRELRRELATEGHRFRSETDSEVVAHVIERYIDGGLAAAVRRAAGDLRGSYAIACVADGEPGVLVAMRQGGSPLVLGRRDGERFLASDIPALLGETKDVLVLGDGEMAVLDEGGIALTTLDGRPIDRGTATVTCNDEAAEKGGYPHFMLKEIFEQPEAVRNTLIDRIDPATGEVRLPELGLSDRELVGLNRVVFLGCGTSWHAGLVGKYLLERFARVPVDVDLGSEFRYRSPVLDGRVLIVPVSQSGETADTLAALRQAQESGGRAVAICNVVGSSLAREADGVVYTRAGIEIGVASTKAFTAQLTAIVLLAIRLGTVRGFLEPDAARRIVDALRDLPDRLRAQLGANDALRDIATRLSRCRQALYLGRGHLYPLALEGALKLKEVSYVNAEGYAAGEMKHGPIALVDPLTPVVALSLQGPLYEKMASNIEEVRARGASVIAIATDGDDEIAAKAEAVVPVPRVPSCLEPLVTALPLQLLAYHAGVQRGCDVDQPRNLAKSVTVE
jgi:glucosamine--fructose-6-phosphate aminotransferase (isomerizing)